MTWGTAMASDLPYADQGEADQSLRPVWEDTPDETDADRRPPSLSRRAADGADVDLLLATLADAADALARLDARVAASDETLRVGLLARLALAEAAGWLAHAQSWVHPLDLALRAAGLTAPAALAASGADGALVSLGGDIAVAGTPPKDGWRVLVAEDCSVPPSAVGEVITLAMGGIATSSTTVRRWSRAGVKVHHLVDPRNGMPASGPWRTATVVADTCVDANIASTAAIVMSERAPAWLERHGLASRLVDRAGNVHRLAGWPQADSKLVPNVL